MLLSIIKLFMFSSLALLSILSKRDSKILDLLFLLLKVLLLLSKSITNIVIDKSLLSLNSSMLAFLRFSTIIDSIIFVFSIVLLAN